jgi:hypothetical protein
VKRLIALAVFVATLGMAAAVPLVHAADVPVPSDFNLQVTPSPLVTTVEPGVKTQVELKIRNGGSGTENLKIEPRAFTLDSGSDKVNLLDTTPPDIGTWISFSAAKFTVAPGQWQTEQVTFNVPKAAGFSYSFALVISRQADPKPEANGRLIKGSLAVFTLVNVDRPGATSNLSVTKFSVSKHVYDYLPSTLSVRFRNSGNTITQPYGNIFISRGNTAQTPLATLPVNPTKGYILPGTERTLSADWDDGFPVYKTVHNPDGTTVQKLVWNWANLSKLRIGRYTAHLVAVYNQAGRDVPIEGTVSFWVIPWKILLVLLLVVLLVLFALFVMIRAIIRFIRRKVKKQPQTPAPTPETPQKP